MTRGLDCPHPSQLNRATSVELCYLGGSYPRRDRTPHEIYDYALTWILAFA
jgi:hypothetical protein